MPERAGFWIGKEEYGGVPTPTRPDAKPPPRWRLEMVAYTEVPRSLSIAPDRRSLALIQDRDTSDVWLLDLETRRLDRLTTGRDPAPSWEDTTPVVSPDGSQVAYGDQGGVWLVPTSGGPPRRLVDGGSPHWLGDGRLVISVERDECSRLAVVSLDSPWPQPLARSGDSLDLVGDETSVDVSPDGRLVAFAFHPRADLNRTDIRVADVETGEVRAVTGAELIHDRGPVWSPDGRTLAYAGQRGEWYAVHLHDFDAGAERALTDGEGDFSWLAWHPDGASLVAVRSHDMRDELVTIDVASGEVTVLAPGGTWATPAWTAEGAVVAAYEDHATPPEVRLIVPGADPETIHAPAPAAVSAAPHVTPEEVSFPSGDGLEVHGLLFRPDGASEDRPVPAVVYAHGGPTSVYGDQWDGLTQYFVDRGYAWLAVNFRGSTGRGKAFERGNFDDWGQGDRDDCRAGADYLRTLPWVDGERLAMYGPSYGSYMALCAVTDDPQSRFRAGVCKYGDCDLLTSWTQGDREGVLYSLVNLMGHPTANREAYLEGSPIHRIDELRVPLLVVHGELDLRVHAKQSEQLVDALRRLGKTYEHVTYPTEAHGLLRAGPLLDFQRRLERFLDWHLL